MPATRLNVIRVMLVVAITLSSAQAADENKPAPKALTPGGWYQPGDVIRGRVHKQYYSEGSRAQLFPANHLVLSAQPGQELELSGKGLDFSFNIPANLPSGAYYLRMMLGGRWPFPVDVDGKGVRAEGGNFLLHISRPSDRGSVSLFCPARRQIYVQGEPIQIAAVLRSLQPRKGTLSIELESCVQGKPLQTELARDGLSIPRGEKTCDYVIPETLTAQLAPGRYRLKATFQEIQSNPYEFELVTSKQATGYPIIYAIVQRKGFIPHFPFAHGRKSVLAEVVKDGAGVPMWARAIRDQIAALGVNMVLINFGPYPPRAPLPELPAPDPVGKRLLMRSSELTRSNYYWNAAAQELLRSRVGLVSMVMSGNQPSAVPELVGQQRRLMAISAQGMRKMPSLIALQTSSQDESLLLSPAWGPRSPTPQNFMQYRSNHIGVRTRWADRWLEESLLKEEFRKATGMEPLGATVEWLKHIYRRQAGVLKGWRDELDRIGAGCLVFAGWTPDTFLSLYHPSNWGLWTRTDLEHGFGRQDVLWLLSYGYDWGNLPFQLGLVPDLAQPWKDVGKPVWKFGYGQGPVGAPDRSVYLRDCVEIIAHGAVAGMSIEAGDVAHPIRTNTNDTWHHQLYGNRAHIQTVTSMLRQYGDAFLELGEQKDLAILLSFSEGAARGWADRRYGNTIYGLAGACLFAHHPAKFVYESDVLAGKLKDYRALIITGITRPLPEPVRRGISEFIRAGGIVLVDDTTRVEVPGSRPLGVRVDGYAAFMAKHKIFRRIWQTGPLWLFWNVYRETVLPMVPELKKVLDELLPPKVDCSNPMVLINQRPAGKGTYLFATNYSNYPTQWTSVFPKPPEEEMAFPWKPTAIEQKRRPLNCTDQMWARPVREKLILPGGDQVIYDLWSRREVTPRSKGGRRMIEADFSAVSAHIWAMMPARIARVELATLSAVARGRSLSVRVRVLDSGGKPIESVLPVAIRILTDTGDVRHEVFRAASAEGWEETFTIALNEPTAALCVQVQDLLSGKTAEQDVQVAAAKKAPRIEKLNDVLVFDPGAVHEFFSRNKPLYVVVDSRQKNLREPLARLRELLRRRKVSFEIAAPEDVIIGANYFLRWQKGLPLPPNAHVPGDVVLLGGAGENLLIDELHRTEVLPRLLADGYPGPGRCLIQYGFSLFADGFDTLCLFAQDVEGLLKGIERLDGIASRKPKTTDRFTLGQEAARMALMPQDVKRWRRRSGKTVPSLPTPREQRGRLRARDVRLGQAVEPGLAQRIGNPIWAMDVSDDGKLVAVGTDSAFENVFLIEADSGEIKKSIAAPGRWVHQVALAPEDKKLWVGVSSEGQILSFDLEGKRQSRTEAAIPVVLTSWTHFHHVMPFGADAPYFLRDKINDRMIFNLSPGKLICLAKDGDELWTIDYRSAEGKVHTLTAMVLSADGNTLAYTTRQVEQKTHEYDGYVFKGDEPGEQCTVHVVDTATGQEKAGFACEASRWPGNAERLAVSPDGSVLVAPGKGKTLFVDRQGKKLGEIGAPSRYENYLAKFSPDGKKAALWPLEGISSGAYPYRASHLLVLRDMVDGSGKTFGAAESVCDVDWTADGKYLMVSRWDGTLTKMTPAGEAVWTRHVVLGAKVKVLPDGRVLAGTAAGRLFMFDERGKQLWKTALP